MNIGVLLSGNGVYDGAELQETVFVLAAIDRNGATAMCMAPNVEQHHVINHLTGEEMPERRNVLVEAARVARGAIRDVETVGAEELDAIVLPGGFGTAKNLTSWAFDGPSGSVHDGTAKLLRSMHAAGKPIVGLCMAPVVIAKSFQGHNIQATLTVGSAQEASPYDIAGINQGVEATGAIAKAATLREIVIDNSNRVITAPCYMMEGSISQIQKNINQALDSLFEMLSGQQ
jgi:enhancing lycopene biosynthesis protein 2